jgi:hypothetical protein
MCGADRIGLPAVSRTLSSTGYLARKTKMILTHHFTYFNLTAHASKLPSPSY